NRYADGLAIRSEDWVPAEVTRNFFGDRGAAKRARKHPHERYTDLDSREKVVRVLLQDEGSSSARVPLGSLLLKACLPGRKQCDFRHGEQSVDDGEEENDYDFGDDA